MIPAVEWWEWENVFQPRKLKLQKNGKTSSVKQKGSGLLVVKKHLSLLISSAIQEIHTCSSARLNSPRFCPEKIDRISGQTF